MSASAVDKSGYLCEERSRDERRLWSLSTRTQAYMPSQILQVPTYIDESGNLQAYTDRESNGEPNPLSSNKAGKRFLNYQGGAEKHRRDARSPSKLFPYSRRSRTGGAE